MKYVIVDFLLFLMGVNDMSQLPWKHATKKQFLLKIVIIRYIHDCFFRDKIRKTSLQYNRCCLFCF